MTNPLWVNPFWAPGKAAECNRLCIQLKCVNRISGTLASTGGYVSTPLNVFSGHLYLTLPLWCHLHHILERVQLSLGFSYNSCSCKCTYQEETSHEFSVWDSVNYVGELDWVPGSWFEPGNPYFRHLSEPVDGRSFFVCFFLCLCTFQIKISKLNK